MDKLLLDSIEGDVSLVIDYEAGKSEALHVLHSAMRLIGSKTMFAVMAFALMFASHASAEVADKDLKIQSIENDKFSRAVTINGSKLDVNPFGGKSRSWFIRSFYNKETHIVRHQLYVDISYLGGWAYYQSADDEDAKPLNLTSLNKNVESCHTLCSFDETVVVELDEPTLKAKILTGYEIKMSAKNGESFVLKISSEQIRAQLLTISTNFAAPNQLSIGELAKIVAANPTSSLPSKVIFGVKFFDLPTDAATAMHHDGLKAAIIVDITKGSVADKAGVMLSDTIFEFDGKPIQCALDLQKAVAAIEPSSKVSIKLLRGRESRELTLNAQF